MKSVSFPIFKTKIDGLERKFNLTDSEDQKIYFQLKAGSEIEKLKEFLEKNSFVAYFLGKKNAGKGTYSKMFAQIVGPGKIEHFSVGDMIRAVDEELKDDSRKKEFFSFLEKNYRGPLSLQELIKRLEQRSTKTLLPTELILALVKREILKREKKTLFIDGFPRNLDQISFALFFRDLIGYRDDPDVFILIDVPESVIDARIKERVICPKCQTPRNLKLLSTKKIGYDENSKKFYLICDNPGCEGVKMVPKEGDELGIESIRERLETDEKMMGKALSLYGIPKVLLRNSIPKREVFQYVDDYEITPEYNYQYDPKEKIVKVKENPWEIIDDDGQPAFSLLPPPVVISMVKQLVKIFNL